MTERLHFHALGKEMAPHSSTLAWRIPGPESLVGCRLWGHTESDTTKQLHFHFSLSCIREEMATHSSVLAWRIPGTGEPGELPSMGSHKVGHDWSHLAAAAVKSWFIFLFFFFFLVTFEYFYKLEKSIFEDLLCFGRGIAKKSIPIKSKDVVPMILLS